MDTTAYYQATRHSDEQLHERQAEINAAQEAGNISAAQAADLRVAALERHLAACRQARHTHLESRHDSR
jgi:hypothetical protein